MRCVARHGASGIAPILGSGASDGSAPFLCCGRALHLEHVDHDDRDVVPAAVAHGGLDELSHGLLGRTADEFDEVPAAQLLEGVLELEAGNYVLAAEALSRLSRQQPANARLSTLLARAYARRGEDRLVIHDYADTAARADASPYMLALVARAHENDGRRDLAAPLLDRAAQTRPAELAPVARGSEFGALLATGQMTEARGRIARNLASNPGSAFHQAIAGDILLFDGDMRGALAHYRRAAQVRLSESLMLRMIAASARAGQPGEAAGIARAFVAANPGDNAAKRVLAAAAAQAQDWPRARSLLEAVRANGGGDNPRLLADLSRAQLRCGDAKAAETTATTRGVRVSCNPRK